MQAVTSLGMKLAVILIFVVGAAGCRDSSANTASSTAKEPSGSGHVTSQSDREAAIYAAAVRQLVTKDHTFGGGDPGFKIVYVVDGAVERAEDPTSASEPKKPFSHDLKDGVRFLSSLAELPPVEFVAERDLVVIGTQSGSSPGHVKNHGVLISLGPIEGEGDRVEVGTSLWINGLAGQWLTYVLTGDDDAWKVTGTTGPMAIS
jgi:hypothetical protein